MGTAVTAKTEKDVARIRELLKTYGPAEVANRTGYSRGHVNNIGKGRRHQRTAQLSIDSLGLRRVQGKKMCRKCGNGVQLVTLDLSCVECALLELGRKGLVHIEESSNGQQSV